jgi:transketolase
MSNLQAIESAIRSGQMAKANADFRKNGYQFGSPQDTSKVHGNALGEENTRKTKQFWLGPEKTFDIPEEVKFIC